MTTSLASKLAAALVLCAAALISAAEPGKRPKIGVALAGGSALGLSHVGVLQWLEENRIPVDYIAGTSMGGLVAGIHATGMNAAEMIEFVRRIDWQTALSPSTPYRNLSFRRKEDAAQFPAAFELGLKNRTLNLPSGLSAGEGVSLVIDRFAAPYGAMDSFDRLPTPFRCVASNLSTGEGVVFDRGSLFDALRATMSLPALFAPFRKDGMVLVDGGLSNNLPVDVVRGMGADIVIAVALDLPADPKDFQSLLGIAGKSVSFMIAANERPNLAAADIVLMPLLKGMTSTGYDRWQEFRRLGYGAAARKAEALRRLQVEPAAYAAHQARRQALRRPASIRPAEVVVEGDLAPKLKRAVVAALQPKAGAVVDRAVLEEQMEKLTGTGRFETATYEFRSSAGRESLIVKVREKSYGPPLLRPAIFLDGANGEGFRFGAGARLTFLDVGGPASEWRTDFLAGTANRLETEYYHRIAGGKWFVAPRAGVAQESLPLYSRGGTRLAQFTEKNFAAGADFGYAFGRREELRVGHVEGALKTSLSTGMLDPAKLSGRYGATHLTVRLDTRDNPIVPRSGSFAMGSVSWFNRYPRVSRQFAAVEGTASRAWPLSPRFTALGRISAAGTAGETGLSTMYRLGGLSAMSALGRNQLLGSRLYYGHAYLLRAIPAGSAASPVKFYGVIGYEAGKAWWPGERWRPRHDGVAGLAGATPLGALFLGGAIGDRGERKFLFRLGRVF